MSTFCLVWRHWFLNTGHSQLLSSSSPGIISRTDSRHVLYWNTFEQEEFHRKSIHREISILGHCGDMKDQSVRSHGREWLWESVGVRMLCGSQRRLSSTGGNLSTAMFITRKAIRKGPRCFYIHRLHNDSKVYVMECSTHFFWSDTGLHKCLIFLYIMHCSWNETKYCLVFILPECCRFPSECTQHQGGVHCYFF